MKRLGDFDLQGLHLICGIHFRFLLVCFTLPVSLTAQSLTVSGYILDSNDEGISDVPLRGWQGSDPRTNDAGFYSGTLTAPFTGEISPQSAAYVLAPALRHYVGIASDQINQNYRGRLLTSVEWHYNFTTQHEYALTAPGTPSQVEAEAESFGAILSRKSDSEYQWLSNQFGPLEEFLGTGGSILVGPFSPSVNKVIGIMHREAPDPNNLIVNGEFLTSAVGWSLISHAIANWQGTLGWDGSPGWFFINDRSGVIPETSQHVQNLIPGETYTLRGYLFRHTQFHTGNPFRILLDSNEIFSGAGTLNEWEEFSVDFAASSSQAIVRFRSQVTGDDAYGIDGISLKLRNSAPPTGPLEARRLLTLLNNSVPYYSQDFMYNDEVYTPGVNDPEPVRLSVDAVNADSSSSPDIWMRKFPWSVNFGLDELGYDGNSWYRDSGNVKFFGENSSLPHLVPYREFLIRPFDLIRTVPIVGTSLVDFLEHFSDAYRIGAFSDGFLARAPIFTENGEAKIEVFNGFGGEWPILPGPISGVRGEESEIGVYDPVSNSLNDSGESFRRLFATFPVFSGGSAPLLSKRLPRGIRLDVIAEYGAEAEAGVGLKVEDGKLRASELGFDLALNLELSAEANASVGSIIASGGLLQPARALGELVIPTANGANIPSLFEPTTFRYENLTAGLPLGRIKFSPITVVGSIEVRFLIFSFDFDVRVAPISRPYDIPFGVSRVRAASPVGLTIYTEDGLQAGYGPSGLINELENTEVDEADESIIVGPQLRRFMVAVTGSAEAASDPDYGLSVVVPLLIHLPDGTSVFRHVEHVLSSVQIVPDEVDYLFIDMTSLEHQIEEGIAIGGLGVEEAVEQALMAIDMDQDGIPDQNDTSLDFGPTFPVVYAENAAGAPGQTIQLMAKAMVLDEPHPFFNVEFFVDGVSAGQGFTDEFGMAALSYTIPGTFSEGVHALSVHSTAGTSTAQLFVVNSAPVAEAGEDQIVECDATGSATLLLNGSNSTDIDSSPGTNDHIVQYSWYEEGTVLGTGEQLTVNLSLGLHAVKLVVEDAFGLTDMDFLIVEVKDTTPPEISLSVSPNALWPANHKLVEVVVTATVTDECDSQPTLALVSVTSDESEDSIADGKTDNDIQDADVGTPDFNVSLRAERSGKGDGRVYTLTYRAEDASGNTVDASVTVEVPHDSSDHHCDDPECDLGSN